MPALLAAQGTGRIVGRIAEAGSGAPVAGAQVELVGTAAAASVTAVSAIDGRYTLLDAPAGTIDVRVRMIGYQPKLVTGVTVRAGSVTAQDVAMDRQVIELQEVAVAAGAASGSVNRALEEQRDAAGIVNSVSAEQIARSPDGDAGQAVQRVSGVTVQDGKYVFVRGLGERYTTTSLNGARIPSPEPERKVVPLDLFPSNLLEGISTSKTFTPDQAGDFSGASVNLKTREFPLGRVATLSTSVGANTAATANTMLKAPTTGSEWLGFAGRDRALPAPLAGLRSTAGRTDEQVRQLALAMRNAWTPSFGKGAPNSSFALSVGGEDPVVGRQLVGYIASLSYGYSQEVREGEQRAVVARTGDTFGTLNELRGTTGRASVLWGGMLNLSTRLGAGTKLGFNNSLTRSADNEANRLAGVLEEFPEQPTLLTRLSFTERTVRSNQLSAEHLFGDRHHVDWSVTSSGVRRYEPDRADMKYTASVDPATGGATPLELYTGNFAATRTFSDLRERAWDLGANYRYTLGAQDNPAWLKVGGAYRTVHRDASSQPYDLRVSTLTAAERSAAAEEIFDGRYSDRVFLSVNQIGGEYTADDRIGAGYAMVDFPLTRRVRLLGGARVERWSLDLTSFDLVARQDTTVGRRNTDVLPSLGVNVILSETQNLRFSATQTLSRPEYREISSVQSYNAIDNLFLQGNLDLQRSLIQNYDVRWEWYPRAGEVLSLGVFAKRFDDPIERVYRFQTGAVAAGFINADKAVNYGVELEARKSLDVLSPALAPLSVFANATLMRSEITPGDSLLTSAERPMVGQSPYVVNAGLAFNSGAWSATGLYNVVGRRITEAGYSGFPDVYEEARHLVDFSLQAPVAGGVTLKLDAKNLLDTPVRITQDVFTRLRYTTGRTFSLGLRWTL